MARRDVMGLSAQEVLLGEVDRSDPPDGTQWTLALLIDPDPKSACLTIRDEEGRKCRQPLAEGSVPLLVVYISEQQAKSLHDNIKTLFQNRAAEETAKPESPPL